MLLIFDGKSEHATHLWRKTGFFSEKFISPPGSQLNKCLKPWERACTPPPMPWFCPLLKNHYATHTWKFLTLQNFLLRMHPWKKNQQVLFYPFSEQFEIWVWKRLIRSNYRFHPIRAHTFLSYHPIWAAICPFTRQIRDFGKGAPIFLAPPLKCRIVYNLR